jgi:transposase
VRSALEWAQVRTLAADGLSQREISRRLQINRWTVARMLASEEPPRYRRAPAGSRLPTRVELQPGFGGAPASTYSPAETRS